MIELMNDVTIKNNLIKAAVMTLLYPLLKDELEYKQSIARYKVCDRSHTSLFRRSNTLGKRVKQLEARQILLEADLTSLEAQLELEKVNQLL